MSQVITSAAGNKVKLIDGIVKVSAFYRCRSCGSFPGELHQLDRFQPSDQTVRTTQTCQCGHVIQLAPIPV